MVDHPSHVTRFSDSSHYDEICVLCGTTDGPGGLLEAACPIGRNLKKSHTFEVLYYPERTERKKIRCKTCGETSLDMLAMIECTNPSVEKRAHLFEDVDVMRKIEGTDGREGLSWLETADDFPVTVGVDPEGETGANAEFARGGVITSVCPERPAFLNRTIDAVSAGIEPHMKEWPFHDIRDVSKLTDVINTILIERAHPSLFKEINEIRDVLLKISPKASTTVNIVMTGVEPPSSLTEKIGQVIAEHAKSIGMNIPVRRTLRQPEDRPEDRQAALEKEALHSAKEQIVLRAQKEKLHRDNLAKFDTEPGKGPQYGTKLPDADFVPLYRSEKDA